MSKELSVKRCFDLLRAVGFCCVVAARMSFAQDTIQTPAATEGDLFFEDVSSELSELAAEQEEVQESSPTDDIFWNSASSAANSENTDVTSAVKIDEIVAPSNEYSYASFGKSDPFVPPKISTRGPVANVAEVPEVPIISVLQKYEVGELSLVGVWETAAGQKKLLVTTPKGEAIVARNGDPIGKKGGLIVGIERDRVMVREFSLAPDGTRKYSETSMALGATKNPDGEDGLERGVESTEESSMELTPANFDPANPTSMPDSRNLQEDAPLVPPPQIPGSDSIERSAADSDLTDREFKQKAYRDYVKTVQERQ